MEAKVATDNDPIGPVVDRLVEVLDCKRPEVVHWVKLLGSRIPKEGLTGHQIASIGAVVYMRQNTPQTRFKLERFFARLAFMTDPDSEWAVIRQFPRKEPEIVFGPFDTNYWESLDAAMTAFFDKTGFLRNF